MLVSTVGAQLYEQKFVKLGGMSGAMLYHPDYYILTSTKWAVENHVSGFLLCLSHCLPRGVADAHHPKGLALQSRLSYTACAALTALPDLSEPHRHLRCTPPHRQRDPTYPSFAMAYAEIERLEATLLQILNAFVPPAQIDVVGPRGETIAVNLSVADSAAKVWPSGRPLPADAPNLPHTANNAALHAFTDQLSRLLEELDSVDTRNDDGIRIRRKDVVRMAVQELETTDEWIKRILSIYKYGNGAGPSAHAASFGNYQPQIHLSLAHHQYPVIFFDMSLPPTPESVPVDENALPDMQASRGVWAAEATYPPSTDLTLSSERLPWTIWVKSNVHETVHVADVLRCIYRSLQTPVTDEEFAALDAGRSFHVHAAYRARCHRCQTPKEYEEEKKVGVRRIDFLMGRHMFAGLSASLRDRASGTWILHIL